MADNTTLNVGTLGDVIATDDLTTLNGGAVSGFKVQRIKSGYGVDSSLTDVSNSSPFPVDVDPRRTISYYGRSGSFRIPGRAGTTGQKLYAIFNAVGSTVLVDVEKVIIDQVETVVKAVTVQPPMVRAYRVTVLPTNGTAGTKVARDTNLSSNASVTLFQDASADGTVSASALTATLPSGNILDQGYGQRLITAVGYETADSIIFFQQIDERITLRAGQGVVIALDYTLATQNPTTDHWLVALKWTEYTVTP